MISLFYENLKISLVAVFANKTKSLLTALGIIIGVLSVTLMGTLISGLDRSFESSMSWLGKDVLYVSRYEWFSDMEWWEVKNRPRMRSEYVDYVGSAPGSVGEKKCIGVFYLYQYVDHM